MTRALNPRTGGRIVASVERIRLLRRYEPELSALHASGDTEGETLLYGRIERSAHALVILGDLERYLRLILGENAPDSERGIAYYLRLVAGGRDERTIRRWRSGELLIPESAADYIGRIRDLHLTTGKSRRLQMEIALD